MSVASELAQALDTRLQNITVANGYQTDIGLLVFRGKPRIPQEDVPCTVIYEGADKITDEVQSAGLPVITVHQKLADVQLKQRYFFEGHTACDPDHPNDAAHMIIADLKRALFNGDRSFGKLVRKIGYGGRAIGKREDGLAIISAYIILDLEIVENLAAP